MPAKANFLNRKFMLALIVAIIVIASVSIILVGTDNESDDIVVTIIQAPIPIIPAGSSQLLCAEVSYRGNIVTEESELLWSIEPADLGTFDSGTKANVTFEAGDKPGSGMVELKVTFNNRSGQCESIITVGQAILSSVIISPASSEILVDEEIALTTSVLDSTGSLVEEAEYEWVVSGVSPGNFALDSTNGPSVTFSASVAANITLAVTASWNLHTVSDSATICVSERPVARTMNYSWYGMFAHPIGEWIQWRHPISYVVEFTDSYPYLYKPYFLPLNDEIWSFMRLNVSGRNLPELTMNGDPVFLPYLSGEDGPRGGTAVIGIYMNYFTEAELHDLYPGMLYDGYVVYSDWTVTLDEQAAKAVLGLTDVQFDNFDIWWTAYQSDVEDAWGDWLNLEGNDRYDIYNAYGYWFVNNPSIGAEKIGDQIMLDIDTVGWGMDVLMARWMNHALMPAECLMEDMTFNAVIGPETADINVDAAVAFALFASDPGADRAPCWIWQPMMLDYIESSPSHPISLYDAYSSLEYNCTASGSESCYGTMMDYDYTPAAWNLSENETMSIEWPEGEQLFLLNDAEDTGDGTFEHTIDLYAAMTVNRIEPLPSDAPDVVTVDLENRRVTFTGPFDMWHWSKQQSSHEFLSDEWDRLGQLPYGIPFIEFSAYIDSRALSADRLEIEPEEDMMMPIESDDDSAVSMNPQRDSDEWISNVVMSAVQRKQGSL